MSETNQPIDTLQDVRDIKRMMERSTRFISLSGLSGIAAGIWALAGAWVARYVVFADYYRRSDAEGPTTAGDLWTLKWRLMVVAGGVFVAAFLSAFYFTWRKSNDEGLRLWNPTSRRLFWNLVIPLAAGGLFILALLQHRDWHYVAPCCLIFYGLALVNASKYTLTDIRYLGYCEILLGLLNTQWLGHGLAFWAAGFGVLHIVYGVVMWWKYERKADSLKS
jgi:hypothetical protein